MSVHLEPWSEDDLPVLQQTLGDPASMTYLGGPESPEQLVARNAKFLALPSTGAGEMFTIVDDTTGEKVGSVGYWEKEWRDEDVYETGWNVIRTRRRMRSAASLASLCSKRRSSNTRRAASCAATIGDSTCSRFL